MASDLETWSIIAGAASPVIVALVGARVQAYRTRNQQQATAEESAQDRLDRQEEGFRVRLIESNMSLTQQLKEEEAAKKEAMRDRDRGWWLARWWETMCHRINHAYKNGLHVANLRLQAAGLQPVVIEEFDLPGLEDPKPVRKDGQT